MELSAINLFDHFGLVAVWEYYGKRWQLLQVARLPAAISLCHQGKRVRLVFPSHVNPNG